MAAKGLPLRDRKVISWPSKELGACPSSSRPLRQIALEDGSSVSGRKRICPSGRRESRCFERKSPSRDQHKLLFGSRRASR